MRLGLMLASILILAVPAAAEVPIDFSWTSLTMVDAPDGGGPMVGGTISGRDPAAIWDRDANAFHYVHEGRTFGGTFIRVDDPVAGPHWNQALEVPTHPGYLDATGGTRASTLLILEETPTGIAVHGSHGSVLDMVRFSGTGTRLTVSAAEPATGLLLVGLGLVAARGLRRR